MKRTFIVRDDEIQARLVAHVHAMRRDGLTPQVTVAQYRDSRSTEQNAMLHALCADISRQKTWAGQQWDVESWKRLLTAAWCRTRNTGVQIVPAVDGQGFDVLYQHTSKLSIGECADLLTYILAWCADQDVRVSDPR